MDLSSNPWIDFKSVRYSGPVFGTRTVKFDKGHFTYVPNDGVYTGTYEWTPSSKKVVGTHGDKKMNGEYDATSKVLTWEGAKYRLRSEKAGLKTKLEIRWAESSPIAGVTDDQSVALPVSSVKLYLHKTILLSNNDIISARIRKRSDTNDKTKSSVELELPPTALKKFVNSLKANQKKKLLTILDGQVVGVATSEEALSMDKAIIGHLKEDDANKIISILNAK